MSRDPDKWHVKTRITPYTWKGIASAFVMAVADVANGLREIASALRDAP